MRISHGSKNGTAAPVAIVLLALVVLIVPLLLHFTLKKHCRLPPDALAAYPADQPFVSGELFAATVVAIMDHELSSPTGWRPNDFFLWGPSLTADNKANRQLGIIQAVRESVRILRDNLTKVSATEFDENLVEAEKLFRNDEKKFWFPSAEGRFRKGIAALKRYIAGLKTDPPTSKPIAHRNVELIKLFQAWTDLLGGAHATLFKDREADGSRVSAFHTDNYFYHAQGFAHVMYHLTVAVRREYQPELAQRTTVMQLFDEIEDALGRAAVLKPLIVLDGSPSGLFANHRRNLGSFIVDARQKLYSIREELEK